MRADYLRSSASFPVHVCSSRPSAVRDRTPLTTHAHHRCGIVTVVIKPASETAIEMNDELRLAFTFDDNLLISADVSYPRRLPVES
jgi:hypothetical protein